MGVDYVDLYFVHWPVVLAAKACKAAPNATDEDMGTLVDMSGNAIIDFKHSTKAVAADHGKVGSFEPTWRALQALVKAGKTRAIGVSNFNIEQLEEVVPFGGDMPLSNNQIEAHPQLPNTELMEFMDRHGILKSVYSPFAPR